MIFPFMNSLAANRKTPGPERVAEKGEATSPVPNVATLTTVGVTEESSYGVYALAAMFHWKLWVLI